MRLRAVVVEDQPVTRAHIASMLEAMDVDVVAECGNGLEAVQCVPALVPDVVFMDIEMPELNAFEVIDAIGMDEMPPVVFITAYDHYSLRAFDVFASGYLLKPVTTPRLAHVVERLQRTGGNVPSTRRARGLARFLGSGASPTPARLVVQGGGRMVFVRTSDVEYIEACRNYALIHARGVCHQTRQTMLNLQRRLAGSFARIHRSYLVNVEHISELRAAPYGEYDVVLRSGKTLRVTRRFRTALEERLRHLP
jgi:two-component system LytT family response regulator